MRILLILLWLLPSAAMADDALGRLFTTPAERASLNAQRQLKKIQEPDASKAEEKVVTEPVLPPTVSVQGYVKRSDGKNGTVWVNQTPVQEGASTVDVQVSKLTRDSNKVEIKLPATGRTFKLKAGQVYVPETGDVAEFDAPADDSRIEASKGANAEPEPVAAGKMHEPGRP